MEELIGSGAAGTADGSLIGEATTESFVRDVIDGSRERPVLVDFQAEWCGPCKQLTPLLEKHVRANKGKLALVKVDIDRHREIAAQLRIQSVPTVYAFYQGRPVDAFQGALPERKLAEFIAKLLKNCDQGRSAVDELLEEADAALGAGEVDLAEQIFRTVIEMEAGHPGALAGLAGLALERGDPEEATRRLDEVAADKANDPAILKARASIDLARQAESAGDVAALEARLAAAPGDFALRHELALALAARGKSDEAAEHLLEIIRRERDWNEGAARTQLLRMFDAAGAASPFSLRWRRRLSSILFA